jgi:hypothetical protein
MIDTLIWSKDRAMQLDLLLRSQLECFPGVNATEIVYATSTPDFECGYKKLIEKWQNKDISFRKQGVFKDNVLDVLSCFQSTLVLGNSDDNVFISEIPDKNYALDENTAALSLRLNPNVNFCHPANLPLQPPVFGPNSTFMFQYGERIYEWDWTTCDPRGCWGYPHPCDSNLYRLDDWIELLQGGAFHNPCSMELWMNRNRPSNKPKMQCFSKTKLVSVSNNRIDQGGSNNPHGDETQETLNAKWLDDWVIDYGLFRDLQVSQCHIVKPYTFVRE